MSFEIPTASVQEYKSNVEMLLQQNASKLRHAVTSERYTGKAGKVVEQLGAVTARKRRTRHGDTPLISTPHDARWVYPEDYDWADMIDTQDRLRIGIEPTGAYTKNGSAALGRAIDDEIIAAFFGDAKTGENGTAAVPFDAANQVVDAATAGLTIGKLLAARKILKANEVDMDSDKLFCAITAEQDADLLEQTQVTSADFNVRPVLSEGRVTSFLGFTFVHIERLPVDGSGDRRVPVWAESGMHLGIWEDLKVDIGPRRDKNMSTQIYISGTYGSTRLQEGKVVEIKCVEA